MRPSENLRKSGAPRSLSRQIQNSFMMAGGFALFMALVMVFFVIQASLRTSQTQNLTLPLTQYANQVDKAVNQAHLDAAEFMLGSEPTLDEAGGLILNAETLVRKALDKVSDSKQKQDYDTAVRLLEKYRSALTALGEAPTKGEKDSNFFLLSTYYSQITFVSSRLAQTQWESMGAMTETSAKATRAIAVVVVSLVALGIVFGLRLDRRLKVLLGAISGRVRESSESIRRRASNSSAASDEMAASAEQVSRAMEEVAKSVEEVTVGSSSSASATQDIADLNNRIYQMVKLVSEGAERILQSVEFFQQNVAVAGKAVDQGIVVAEATNQAMASALSAERGSSDAMAKLTVEIERVSEILKSVQSISSQTELLSLNATIEAARAQEHGRGFAVVADEIKKLSSKTAQATLEISDLVESINNVAQQVVAELGQNLASSQAVVQQATTLKDSFDGIARGVKGLMTLMDQIVREAQSQFQHTQDSSALSEKVMLSTEQIAAQVEEVSAAMEELSSTVQEVLAASEEMRSNAHLQAQTAGELNELADVVAAEMERLV